MISRAFLRNEPQRHAVVAVTQSGRLRAVIEDVSLVAPTANAMVFGAGNDQLEVLLGGEAAGNQGKKARPSGAAVVFHLRAKQWQRAAGADENAGALFSVERTRERMLRALLTQDVVLHRRQDFLPF